jgi:hypothetical protein
MKGIGLWLFSDIAGTANTFDFVFQGLQGILVLFTAAA